MPSFTYKFTVLKEQFGWVGMSAPAIGFVGTRYAPGFALVNLTLDAKKKCDAEIVIRILDDQGKPVATPVKYSYPRDLPDGTELEKLNFVPFAHPIFLNRQGRFTVEIEARDNNGKTKKQLRYPMTVLDVNSYTK